MALGKDEDELAQALGLGLMSPTEARDLRAEGLRAVELLRAGGPPFDRDWQSWRPDPIWPVPEQPVGWDVVQ